MDFRDYLDCYTTLDAIPRGIVAWTNFTFVIPWLDHGIQLKILVFFIVFMDPVVKRTR